MIKHLCDSEFPYCPPDARSGEFFKLKVNKLLPKHFAVGRAEVAVRTGRMRNKLADNPG
ncbi:MAG: hypothetical protein WBM81_00905 [Sedimenticolaceae bacterium]